MRREQVRSLVTKRTCPAALAVSAIGGKAAVAAAHPDVRNLMTSLALIGPGAAFVASSTVGPVVRQIVTSLVAICVALNETLATNRPVIGSADRMQQEL